MIGWRGPIRQVVVWAAGLAVGAAAWAQAPDLGSQADRPTTALTDESMMPTPADSPTRRPRRPTAIPSETATALATETTTAAPPTSTATRARSTATPTAIPPSATPTRWAIGGGRDIRDSALPLAIGGALALLGVWLGGRIAGAGARAARRRARSTLATAMLLELRRIDAVLRRVVGLDNPASFPSLDHPIMEAALRDLTLFQNETAARIAQFHGALRGIQHEIADYRDNPLRWAGRLSELNQLIKGRAAAACRAVPDLLKVLEKEGGSPPPHLGESPSATGRSNLPPPPFGPSEGDDWTL